MARVDSDLILGCLDDIRAGRRLVEEFMAQHPQAATELRALASLVTAIRIEDAPSLQEAGRLRGRNQLLAVISSNGHRPAEDRNVLAEALAWPARVCAAFTLRPRWLAGLGAGLSALVAGGAVVYAAQGAPPDSPLYPVREAVQVVSQAVLPAPPSQAPSAPKAELTLEGSAAARPSAARPAPAADHGQATEVPRSARQADQPARRDLDDDRARDASDRALPSADHADRNEAERRSFEEKTPTSRDRDEDRRRTGVRGPEQKPEAIRTPGPSTRDTDRR